MWTATTKVFYLVGGCWRIWQYSNSKLLSTPEFVNCPLLRFYFLDYSLGIEWNADNPYSCLICTLQAGLCEMYPLATEKGMRTT